MSLRQRVAVLPTLALMPLAAIVWWTVGFLPWILDGLGRSVFGVIVVPLYAGNVSTMVLGSGLGGLAAGLVALLGRGSAGRSAVAAGAGAAIAAGVSLVQASSVVHNPSPDNFSTDNRVLTGLIVVTVVVTLIGLGWGLLALAGRTGSGMALAGPAGTVPFWITSVLVAAGATSPDSYLFGNALGRWTGAVLLAAALVSIGIVPVARLVWWPVAVVLAWLVAPTLTAAGYAEQLLRPGLPSEMVGETVSAAWQVWRMAAALDARPLTPWIVAVVVAAALSWYLGRVSREDEPSEPDATEPIGPTLP